MFIEIVDSLAEVMMDPLRELVEVQSLIQGSSIHLIRVKVNDLVRDVRGQGQHI
jgi:hypothetical protein